MVVGIDEVGRGSWAGPVVAAAVALKRPVPGLKDSKLLTKAQREILAERIQQQAVAFGLGWVGPAEIDKLGLSRAISLAMAQALQTIAVAYTEVVIDGSFNFLATYPKTKTLIKADNLVPAVSAASIIAKVARDHYMIEQAKLFPRYSFEKHVGYGTRLHQELLQRYGICILHRRSFKPIQALL